MPLAGSTISLEDGDKSQIKEGIGRWRKGLTWKDAVFKTGEKSIE